MNFNPQIHHRKSIRLKSHDYSGNGIYFVTICCQDKKHRFGKIEGAGLASAHIVLNEFGNIAKNEWGKLSQRFSMVELGEMQIMPDHMHGIIIFKNGKNDLAEPNYIGAQESSAIRAEELL